MSLKSTQPAFLTPYLHAKAKAEKAAEMAANLAGNAATAAKIATADPEHAHHADRASDAAKLAAVAEDVAVKARADVEAVASKIRPALKGATAEFLLPLAAKLHSEPSQANCKDALRLAGLPIKLFRDLQTVSGKLFRTRSARRAEKSRRLCRKGNGRAAVILPKGTPRQRLDAKIKDEVWEIVDHATRTNVRHDLEIRLSTDGTVNAGTDKSFAGKAGNWTIYSYDTTVTVPRDWRRSVKAKGIAKIGETVVLKVGNFRFPASANGIAIAPVVYLAQGAGANVAAKDGFVAKSGDLSCLAATEAGAVRRMKSMIAEADAERVADEARAEARRVNEEIRKAEDAARAEAEEIRRAASVVLDDSEADILAGLGA